MEWKTPVTEMLGCKYPIIEGALHMGGTSKVAAPVSEAGGFGIITAGALKKPDKFRDDIRRAKDMTDKPFGINISIGFCKEPEKMLEVALNEGIKHLETSVYIADNLGKMVKEAGGVWMHKVAHLDHAIAAERQGADAVCIVGLEGVGEKGFAQVTTLTSVTMAKKALKVPVIAAGGIGDGRSFLSALVMGADAVVLGTAFYICQECPTSEKYKQRLVAMNPLDKETRDLILLQGEDTRRDERLREGTDHVGAPTVRMAQVSMAIGYYDRIPTVKDVIDGIIGEAEEIMRREFPFTSSKT
jgi:NAD(P)H-dependent flavin oxidoreductase YrpB (nitropropane dioxygenase family)